MRVCYFVLMACTATMTSSTNSSETSSPAMKKNELAADVRSTHGGHDGFAIYQLPEVHDPTTGEERVTPNAYRTHEEIANAILKLVDTLHPTAPITDGISPARQSKRFDFAAITHYVTTILGDPENRLEWLQGATSAARMDKHKRDAMVEVARESYRAHYGDPRAAVSVGEFARAEMHPARVLEMLIPAYESVTYSISATMVYEELSRYIEMYNAKSQTTPVKMIPTLYEGFGDVTKVASFSSEAMLGYIRALPVEQRNLLMPEYQKRLIATIVHVAAILGIFSTHRENVSSRHSMDTLARYISKIMDLLPSSHPVISTHLTMAFGDQLAALLMERARGVNPS